MSKKETFVNQLNVFLESQGLQKEDAKGYLIEVFTKAFGKDRDALSRYDEEEPEPANVEVEIDMEKGTVNITRTKDVVKEKTIIGRFTQIEAEDEELVGKNLSVGDKYVEKIDLDEINNSKKQHIKQLFLQKLSEIEKIKIYNKFSKFKGTLLNAKVHRILNRGNVILDYDGDSIFMPASEIPFSDSEKIKENEFITVYILEIEEMSKDAQIIASRKNPQFIAKLIEREIDDVSDGTVVIEEISREPGFKSKVAVSSTMGDVDPVGSIIGVKGQRIKPILDQLNGERLDIIKHTTDIKEFIVRALSPASVVGIKITETEEDLRQVVIVVEKDQFLPAIGKKGMNIKLAAILTKSRIDVKTIEEATEEGIEWEKVLSEKRSYNKTSKFDDIEYGDFSSIEDLAENDTSTFSDDDYDLEEIKDSSIENYDSNEDENNFEDDYEEEYGSK